MRGTAHGQSRRGGRGPHDRRAWPRHRRTAAASGIGCIRCAGFAFPGPFDYERGISLIRGVRKFERIYGLDVAATLYPLLRECGTEEFRYVNDAAASRWANASAGSRTTPNA